MQKYSCDQLEALTYFNATPDFECLKNMPRDYLKDFEKVQFHAFVQQRIQIALRGFRIAEESVLIIEADELRERVQTAMEELFSSQGVRKCYNSFP